MQNGLLGQAVDLLKDMDRFPLSQSDRFYVEFKQRMQSFLSAVVVAEEIEALDESGPFTFIGEAQVPINDRSVVGVWTDGVGVQSDSLPGCAFPLIPTKKYKVTIEEVIM